MAAVNGNISLVSGREGSHLTKATSKRQELFAKSGRVLKNISAVCQSLACFVVVTASIPPASQFPRRRVFTSTNANVWEWGMGNGEFSLPLLISLSSSLPSAMMSISPQRQCHCRCKISQPCCCNHSATKFSPNVPISREFGDWGELESAVAIVFDGLAIARSRFLVEFNSELSRLPISFNL